jgi:hypothetical protein
MLNHINKKTYLSTLSFPYRASSISYNKCFQQMRLVLYLYFIYLLSPYTGSITTAQDTPDDGRKKARSM